MYAHHNAADTESKSSAVLSGALYVVATPIGHLKDISLRALEILQGADVIACEDTRVSRKLLAHYAIATPALSYHEHNAAQMRPKLLARLQAGEEVALISDAGTPLISDPGYKLVAEARAAGLPVVPVPGACAAIAALSACGLPTDCFAFAGFLPAKAGARTARLRELAAFPGSLVFYESARRALATLRELREALGEREAAMARELTKQHEEILRAPLGELIGELEARNSLKGELVLLLGPPAATQATEEETDRLLQAALQTMSTKEAAKHVAAASGLPVSQLYQRALELKP